jgi:hypothetical protein
VQRRDSSSDARRPLDHELARHRSEAPDEHISWKCPAQRREPGGIWQSAGELYVTEHRLIWQPPRWALAAHRATVSDHHTPDATAPF